MTEMDSSHDYEGGLIEDVLECARMHPGKGCVVVAGQDEDAIAKAYTLSDYHWYVTLDGGLATLALCEEHR